MTAETPAPLEWIAPEVAGAKADTTGSPRSPDADQSRALTDWARTQGVQLTLPRDEAPASLAVDLRVGADVEKLVDRARDAIAGRDADGAERELATAEAMLRAHPELPQASWLMAEVERARSARFRRVPPLDADAADRAWVRAEALDGGRGPGVGEQASAAHPAPATLALDPLPGGATLWFDGHPTTPRAGVVETQAGPHALVVTWDDAPAWAGWIETPAGSSALHLAVPSPPSCSTGDLGQARASDGTVSADGVRCDRWVVATPGLLSGSILVTICARAHCGALLGWNAPRPEGWVWTPPRQKPARSGWPTWATWGLVGAGAVIATGVVLVASGALQASPGETRFVSGGLKTP